MGQVKRITRCAAAVAVVVATSWSATGVSGAQIATKDAPEEHCVAFVEGQTPDGEFLLSEVRCFADQSSALSFAGAGPALDSPVEARTQANQVVAMSMTIGIHYDGANLSGSSFTVSGANCLGGYLNVAPAWDNRISSTLGGCPRVRHWTGANKTGSSQDTLPHGNLVAPVNNAVSSIQYMT